jgi:hypothetical protein
VNYSYKSDEDSVESPDFDNDGEVDEERTQKRSQTIAGASEERIKTYSFWCAVGLGEVVPT